METTLAILMVLGIFVGIPSLIGVSIAGMYILKDSRVRRAEHARAMEEAKEAVKEPTKERTPVA